MEMVLYFGTLAAQNENTSWISRMEGRDGESRLPMVEQIVKTLVGLLRRAETGELSHRPQLPAIPAGMNATREGELTGKRQVAVEIEVEDIRRRGERIHIHPADRGEVLFPGSTPRRERIVNFATPP